MITWKSLLKSLAIVIQFGFAPSSTRSALALVVALGWIHTPTQVQGQAHEAPATRTPTKAEKKAKYSLPYSLRPAVVPNLVRLDTSLALQDTATTVASLVTAGGKPIASEQDLGFFVRGAFVYNTVDGGSSGSGVSNPLLFALYAPEIATNLRLGLFGGVTLPVGAGGGSNPNPDSRAAMQAGIYDRQAMDNALFATNYMTPTAGVALAYIAGGWTLQAEVTFLELLRVRGEQVDTDPTRTNFTSGVHAGYQVTKWLTASLEAHYQRWLSTPAAVQKNSALREQATIGGGLRLNLPLSDSVIMRPGLAYFHPIDDPMASAGYKLLILDVPVAF
jgi:hypothetical protein